jgi:hypothetical protein
MDAHESGQGIVTYISLIVRQSGQTKSQHLRESACAGEILRLAFSDCAKAGAGIPDREVAQTLATTTALPA